MLSTLLHADIHHKKTSVFGFLKVFFFFSPECKGSPVDVTLVSRAVAYSYNRCTRSFLPLTPLIQSFLATLETLLLHSYIE